MTMKTVVLVGTLDTKGAEYQYLRDRLKLSGVKTLLVDVGTLEPPRAEPEISRYDVGAEGGDGQRAAGRARRAAAADRSHDVRGHDSVGDGGARRARAPRLRGPHVPCHRHRRPGDGSAG